MHRLPFYLARQQLNGVTFTGHEAVCRHPVKSECVYDEQCQPLSYCLKPGTSGHQAAGEVLTVLIPAASPLSPL